MKNTITLATYNFRGPFDAAPNDWPSRIERIRKIVADNHFEIYGVQEPFKYQIDDVISGTSFAYIGGGREDFKEAGEHSSIIYDTTRFDVYAGGTFGLSEKPDVPGYKSWETCCPRIASWGKFVDKVTRHEFCYYNTHLDHVSKLAQINGIKMVVDHASKNCGGLPLILTGDFNVFPDSETYKMAASLLNDARLISKTAPKGPKQSWHDWGRWVGEDKDRIDYVFVSNEIEVLSYAVDDTKPFGEFASDHYPVITELKI